jgi:hypothetical protein
MVKVDAVRRLTNTKPHHNPAQPSIEVSKESSGAIFQNPIPTLLQAMTKIITGFLKASSRIPAGLGGHPR